MFKMHEKDKQLNNLKSYRYFLFCGNIFCLLFVITYFTAQIKQMLRFCGGIE